MPKAQLLLALWALVLLSAPAAAKERIAVNPQIDYSGFSELVGNLAKVRQAHRLAWPNFARMSRADGAILLDARSADAYARGHLNGAINLPFTDFTDEALRNVLGDNPDRPIYIYCNNNFRDNAPPVPMKNVKLALNISTFINLHGYGYRNVWELADVIGSTDRDVEWETSPGA